MHRIALVALSFSRTADTLHFVSAIHPGCTIASRIPRAAKTWTPSHSEYTITMSRTLIIHFRHMSF